jgi:hypothetical protein
MTEEFHRNQLGCLTPKFSCERHAIDAQHYFRAAGETPECDQPNDYHALVCCNYR